MSIWLEPGSDNREARELLISLESGPLLLRWGNARGHCSKLLNIYQKHLDKWFARVLRGDELDRMRELFMQFEMVEGGFIRNMNSVANWLSDQATHVLDLLDQGKIQEAADHIRVSRKEIHSFRSAMLKAMQDMLAVQADFIALSGTT